jgi:hypothetical protein
MHKADVIYPKININNTQQQIKTNTKLEFSGELYDFIRLVK